MSIGEIPHAARWCSNIPAHRAQLLRGAAAAQGCTIAFGSSFGSIPMGDWIGVYVTPGFGNIARMWRDYEARVRAGYGATP